MKALIKTIEFTFNGTSSLNNTVVSSVADKNYTSSENEPLWGVEKVDPSQKLNVSDINLLWGLVSDKYENDSEIATIRAKQLYLPVASTNTDMSVFRDSLAVASVFSAAWNSVYQEVAWLSGTSIGGLPSYSGDIQYSLFLKWRELSSTNDGAATILNLIWTDLVASAVVGTVNGFENNSARDLWNPRQEASPRTPLRGYLRQPTICYTRICGPLIVGRTPGHVACSSHIPESDWGHAVILHESDVFGQSSA